MISHFAVPAVVSLTVASAAMAQAGGLIINEWNCVGSQKWIGNPDTPACEGPGGFACEGGDDTFFGRVMGNGGNWIELVVTIDNLDVRGWELRWAETGNPDGDGTVIWLAPGTIRQGIITFTQDPLWANLRAGTIITIIEKTTAQGGLDTDVSFDPCAGDWWININSYDAQYLTTVHNRAGEDPGYFAVGNDNWQGRILNAQGTLLHGPIGEGIAGWQGGGINSREVGRLELNPVSTVNITHYDDGDSSTFGKPNRWSDLISAFPEVRCERYQDFTALRSWVECPCNRVILNEYNAVANANWLNGGDENADENGGQAADMFFGRVQGNGGNWFELVVTGENVDMRGWSLHWEELGENKFGSVTLNNNAAFANLQPGTIITFIERNTFSGGLDSDVSYTLPGGNWINIHTADTNFVASTYHSEEPKVFGRMSVGHEDWRLTIRDAQNTVVFGPSGEGAAGYGGRGVSSREVCILTQDPSGNVQVFANYTDGVTSTFGAPNTWRLCSVTPTFAMQNFNNLLACAPVVPACPADLNNSGAVDVQDLLILLSSWGPCGKGNCPADLNDSGTVDVQDLLILLSSWGPC
ncbi:MAG TPA: hypothetical protein PK400_06100 [Phycisphaerales bacterium]|nr:hypothetical protein [Phycisphaerales bacterium]HRQ76213.1 hypothetical protein [Phycisphaerales bacterium]